MLFNQLVGPLTFLRARIIIIRQRKYINFDIFTSRLCISYLYYAKHYVCSFHISWKSYYFAAQFNTKFNRRQTRDAEKQMHTANVLISICLRQNSRHGTVRFNIFRFCFQYTPILWIQTCGAVRERSWRVNISLRWCILDKYISLLIDMKTDGFVHDTFFYWLFDIDIS